jgi:hypothetical protein
MTRILIFFGVVFLPLSLSAAGLACSTRVSRVTGDPARAGVAKISKVEAEKTALANIKSSRKEVARSGLEAEQGCLVYSFDIRVDSKPGIEKLIVDVGTGKILLRKHETRKQEAAQHAKRMTLQKNLEWASEPTNQIRRN